MVANVLPMVTNIYPMVDGSVANRQKVGKLMKKSEKWNKNY
jgi:hypothetical protein